MVASDFFVRSPRRRLTLRMHPREWPAAEEHLKMGGRPSVEYSTLYLGAPKLKLPQAPGARGASRWSSATPLGPRPLPRPLGGWPRFITGRMTSPAKLSVSGCQQWVQAPDSGHGNTRLASTTGHCQALAHRL